MSMDNIEDISKQELLVKDGQTVITTAQLAEVYGTTSKNITNNFQRNKDRFIEGKHYFVLQGEELKEFKSKTSESGVPLSSANSMYLWTRRGASRHCKILGTDKAWEQFDYLEENYFDRQNSKQQMPLTLQQQIQTIAQGTAKLYERVDNVEIRIKDLENTMTIDHGQQYFLGKTVSKTVMSALGGKKSNAYKQIGRKVFAECNGDLKAYFKVNARANVPKKRYEEAVAYAENWKPCTNTQMMIGQLNAQQIIGLEEVRSNGKRN